MSQRSADPQSTISDFAQPAITVTAGSAIGSWTIERNLGAGAMGEVYLAKRGDEPSALKLVARRFANDDTFTQRFQREIEVLAKLDHPNVARALDWGSHDGRPWLAMEFVAGPSLDSLIEKHSPFFESDVLRLAIQVASGLDHIHQRAGLIHRDVKPANIILARASGGDPKRLLNPGDAAKLIDFGLAKPSESDEHGLTMTGMIMGTPNYIAPEQVACERNLSLHVDMYALGASIYHLLTGRVPYQASSAAAVMAAHLNQPPPDPGLVVPGLSQATRQLVLTAMAKRPIDRFTDWHTFMVASEKALAALGDGAQSATNRLLKKPLAKPPTTAIPRQSAALAAAATSATSAGTVPTASRRRTGSTSAAPIPAIRPNNALEARSDGAALAESLSSHGDGSSALRAAVTSKIIKVQTDKLRREGTHRQGQTSAVHKWSGRLASSGATGGAVLPWVALGVAALLTVAGVVWALLRP